MHTVTKHQRHSSSNFFFEGGGVGRPPLPSRYHTLKVGPFNPARSGECFKLPQWGYEAEPQPQTYLRAFLHHGNRIWWQQVISNFFYWQMFKSGGGYTARFIISLQTYLGKLLLYLCSPLFWCYPREWCSLPLKNIRGRGEGNGIRSRIHHCQRI